MTGKLRRFCTLLDDTNSEIRTVILDIISKLFCFSSICLLFYFVSVRYISGSTNQQAVVYASRVAKQYRPNVITILEIHSTLMEHRAETNVGPMTF